MLSVCTFLLLGGSLNVLIPRSVKPSFTACAACVPFTCFVQQTTAAASAYAVITTAIRLRYDHDPTTIRLRRISRAPASNSTQAKKERQFFVVVVSQSNRTHIVISITSVVVECVVVSSYRSRIVVESQL